MKDGVLDDVDHDEEVVDSSMSFSEAIAPSVMPEVKLKHKGGVEDLVQDAGSMDQLLGSAASEENSLL